ncbi:hypothetical protein [Gordonia hankookensis]|uniref:Uncharacterized protein n=1 Tax=Gordonia hankookensis TaxID=589403 RepID=A0ABR7WGU8_9ACTN|nr:hypothetical protein [Gordonia hankookensis]MBD1321930.1 hypothetical protein [Gordonia hankookensis]NDZ95159.1 hypothetical protein [Streptomyces sp. SID11726]NEB24263.1 hypothetical protein [Streptomyces sp. SID6673]
MTTDDGDMSVRRQEYEVDHCATGSGTSARRPAIRMQWRGRDRSTALGGTTARPGTGGP